MPIQNFPKVEAPPYKSDPMSQYIQKLADIVAIISKNLDYLLNGMLDVKNIRAEGIEARNIKASTITADKMNVTELSAIAADLGTITAGIINGIEIYGSYIATANGTYPRAEMSNTDNLFAAYKDANNYIEMNSDYAGSPVINIVESGTVRGQIDSKSSDLYVSATSDCYIESAGGDVNLNPSVFGGLVNIGTWAIFKNTSTGNTLQDDLNLKANGSGISGTVYVSATSGGPTDVAITFSNGVRTS